MDETQVNAPRHEKIDARRTVMMNIADLPKPEPPVWWRSLWIYLIMGIIGAITSFLVTYYR